MAGLLSFLASIPRMFSILRNLYLGIKSVETAEVVQSAAKAETQEGKYQSAENIQTLIDDL